MKNRFSDSYTNLAKKINTKEGVLMGSLQSPMYISPLTLDSIINNDGLLQIVLEAPVIDSYLTSIESESDEIKEKYLEFESIIKRAILLSRGFGGSYIILDDSQRFRVVSPTSVNVSDVELNPLRDDYLQPKSISLTDISQDINMQDVILVTESSTDEFKKNNNGLGVSVTQKIIEHLLRYDTSLSQSTDILNQLNQSVIKFRDLTDVMSEPGGEDTIMSRLNTINMLSSNLSILAIDGEDEYINVTKTLSGVTDIIKENAVSISAISKILYSRLFGKTISGIGQPNDSDLKNYYDTVVGDIRQHFIKPIFNKMCEKVGIDSVGKWTFKNIVEPSKLEELEEQKINIENSLKLLEQGIIGVDEVRSRVLGDK